MRILKRLTPRVILTQYEEILVRLRRLEHNTMVMNDVIGALVENPTFVPGDDVGFNGQRFRKSILGDIASVGIEAVVETGTYMGDTAGYMAHVLRVPVYSCELEPRYHAVAKRRLAGLSGIHLTLGDSRSFLRDLVRELADQRVFFYLDAHWYADLPLPDEVELIATHWDRCVVMVDDFKVPDDPGYGYDASESGWDLDLDLLRPAIAKHDLVAFFPSARSGEETGGRRGCVVLARKGEMANGLSGLQSLRGIE